MAAGLKTTENHFEDTMFPGGCMITQNSTATTHSRMRMKRSALAIIKFSKTHKQSDCLYIHIARFDLIPA